MKLSPIPNITNYTIIIPISPFSDRIRISAAASPSHLLQHLQGLAPAALAATHGTAVGHEVRNWPPGGDGGPLCVPFLRWENHGKSWKKM